MTADHDLGPKIGPGAHATAARAAEFVHSTTNVLGGIDGTHIEYSETGSGEGRDQITAKLKSDLGDNSTLVKITEPI